MADYIMNDDRDAKDILIELRESTGMNRHQFCEYFEIPYMTVSDWEHGKKRVPKYFLRLLEYYVKAEQMNNLSRWPRAAPYASRQCCPLWPGRSCA